MRVLFVTKPERSVLQHLVPLAWAVRTAGHEVVVAAQPGFAGAITEAGLTAVMVGTDRDPRRLEKPADRAALRVGMPQPYQVAADPASADWAVMRNGYRHNVAWWHRMANFPVIPDLVAFARHWQPDLVVWEPLSYAGAVAAKACGAAHARLLLFPDIFGVTREHYLRLKAEQPAPDREDPLADWLGGYARRYGGEYTEDMATGHFTVDPYPDPLRMAADLSYVPMRFVPYGGPATVPAWLRTPPERPRVALTLGMTATSRFDGYAVSVADILRAVDDLDVEVVATVAESEQRHLGDIPSSARVVTYAPLDHLARSCTAVIHHAGAATLATTSLHGVPQLALPLHFDQPVLAQRLQAQGAGLTLAPQEVTVDSVRDRVRRLLTEHSFRNRAAELSATMRAMPAPNEIVGRLEELTVKYRAR